MSAAQPITSAGKTMEFQAEVKQLLHIVINSLYTHKEIFLRDSSPTLLTHWTNSAFSL